MNDNERKFYDQIEDELRHKPELRSKDNAFSWWFINYQTGDESLASYAITGSVGDKNIDAMWIDDDALIVNVLQTKLRTKFGKAKEKRNDLTALLDLVDIFYDDKKRETLIKKLPPEIVKKILTGVNRVKRKYRIRLWFITTGKVTQNYKEEFPDLAKTYTGNP